MVQRMVRLNRRLHLWLNRLRLSFELRRKGRFFQIVVDRKYRVHLRVAKYVLTVVSVISAFFGFASAIVAFIFGLAVWAVLSVLERAVLIYKTLYVHPLPDFEIEPEKWTHMSFGYGEDSRGKIQVPMVGMVFSDEEYGRKIYGLLASWNYGEAEDKDNNICVSVVLGGEDDYVFFCYPSPDRQTAGDFFNASKQEIGKEAPGAEVRKVFLEPVLGKRFKIAPHSYLPTFIRRYKNGVPYIFQVQKGSTRGNPEIIQGTRSIVKFNLKVRSVNQLTRKDIEYDLLRTLGN